MLLPTLLVLSLDSVGTVERVSVTVTTPTIAQAISQLPASAHFQAGLAAFQTNDYEAAIAAWQAALEGYRAADAQQNIAITLNALAAATQSLGRYRDAIAYSQESAALAHQLNDRELEAQALGNLGIAYQASGRYADAVATYEQALTIIQAQGTPAVEAQLFGLLGNAYEALGDYDSAITAQETSLTMARRIDAPSLEATALMNLGGLYGLRGEYRRAIDQYQVGIALARDIGNLGSAAYGLNNLGGAYQQLGAFQQAIAYFKESLTLAEQTNNPSLQARVLTNLGVAYEDLEDIDASLTTHQHSIAIARTLEDPLLLANALNNLAHAQLTAEHLPAAEMALQESVRLLTRLRQGLGDADKVNVFDTQIYTYNLLMQVQVAQGNYAAALETSEQGRARAFVELVAGEATQLSPLTIDQIQQVARTLNATLVEYAIVPKDEFTVQGRQRGEAGQLFVWVVSPAGEITFRQVSLEGSELSLDDQVQQSRSALGALGRTRGLGVQATAAPSATPQLQEIYQHLIAPIADVLPTDPEALVVLIPHESLFYVPFAALQDAEERYLIEHHTLLTAPAIQLLDLTLLANPDPATLTPLVIGNPAMPALTRVADQPSPPLQPLPGAEAEAQAIARLLQTEAITGSAASESAIVPQMQHADVIHLATHGLLDYVDTRDRIPVPGAIALAPSETADGLLTAREIAQLSLNAQLVVLSACDTGLGEVTGDGVVGLSRSLIAAGANSTVVSLWAVPDAPTAELMATFYTGLQQGQNKAQALRQAMLQTMEAHANPLAWAAFVLVGNPAPLQSATGG
ncbi:MAG: CHAT domain-containing protein [Leptolyngbya sp. SIO1E4]|nr:CHAT domain-containing protein [Leptolyngbya sp. SIO1E4]